MSTPFVLSYLALWAVVVFQGMLLLGTVRAIHSLRQGGPAADPGDQGEPTSERLAGQEVAGFAAVDLSGATISTEQLRGRSTVVLFVSPNCPSCLLALEELSTVGSKAKGNVVVVCGADGERCRRLADDFGLTLTVPVIVDADDEIQRLFDVSSAPTAVLLNPNARIVSYGHPVRGEELSAMMNGETTAAATT